MNDIFDDLPAVIDTKDWRVGLQNRWGRDLLVSVWRLRQGSRTWSEIVVSEARADGGGCELTDGLTPEQTIALADTLLVAAGACPADVC
jgi:hypothetical protein